VLVTGASGGIGSACARAFAEEGCRVVLHYHRGEERARSLSDELGGAPAFAADLTDEEQVDRLFTEARDELGGLEVWPPSPASGRSPTSRSGSSRSRAGRRPSART